MTDSDRVRDVVVAGGGVGGTIAGALLAARGYDVELFERGDRFGGSASSFTHGGFRFDVGASLFYGLRGGGRLALIRRAAECAGVEIPAVPDPMQIHYHLPDNREVRAHYEADTFREELAALFPGERRGIREFYGTLDRICAALDRAYVESLDDPRSLLHATLGAPRAVATIARSSVRDTASLVHRHIRNPELRRFIDLECYCWALVDASRTPLINAAIVFSDRHRGGIAYPVGGAGAIAEAFAAGIERHGGRAHLHAPVEEIVVEGGRACGVRLHDGRVVRSRVVISNVPLRATLERLLPDAAGAAPLRKRLDQFPDADSWFTVWAGTQPLAMPQAVHHVIVDSWTTYQQPGGTLFLSLPSLLDRSAAPDGGETVHAFVSARYAEWSRGGSRRERRERYADEIMRRVEERVLPGVRCAVTERAIGTPLVHERIMGRYRGSYGPLFANGRTLLRRPRNHTGIPGLFAVGDATFPGQGVSAVAASAVACAREVGRSYHVRPATKHR